MCMGAVGGIGICVMALLEVGRGERDGIRRRSRGRVGALVLVREQSQDGLGRCGECCFQCVRSEVFSRSKEQCVESSPGCGATWDHPLRACLG